MTILGIETSCDETAASVVENGTKVLSHVLATSADMHAKTGGIIPEIAAREQVKSILPVITEAIENCKLSPTRHSRFGDGAKIENLDCIAVTHGPGLLGSLLVGIETAKTLAWVWNKPIVPVNHLTGHIYANWLESQSSKVKSQNYNSKVKAEQPKFSALALVVSGGHTDLVLMRDHGKVEWIGGTRDDAAGEAFDKTARLLGLPYPGGPAIAAAAEKFQLTNSAPSPKRLWRVGDNFQLKMFPRPMIDEDNFDWSFSGLKTAVLREVKSNPTSLTLRRAELAAEVQEAIVEVLVEKTLRAVKKFKPRSLLLGGGVAANSRLREKFELKIKNEKLKVDFYVAQPKFCTDNASMIAAAAYYNYKPVDWRKITAKPELTIVGEV